MPVLSPVLVICLSSLLSSTMTVTNRGGAGDLAANVVVSDTLPSGVLYVSSAASAGTVSLSGQVLTAALGNLAGGASATVTLVVRAQAAGTLTNQARVSGAESDSHPADNAAAVSVSVVVPPTVTKLARLIGRRLPPTLALSFSAAMDPARARDASNYRLVSAGRDKKFGTRDDKVIRFKSVAFDPATNRVILTFRQLNLKQSVRLTVTAGSARGLADALAIGLDGNRDGQPGGDYVAIFRPSALPRRQAAGKTRN